MKSAIYEGSVTHSRASPIRHIFSYRVFMLYLDLAELPTLFNDFLFWGTHRFSLARFKRANHYGDRDRSLDLAIRDLVEKETGKSIKGPIRLLTNLSYFGYCFNPVSFYYCFDEHEELQYIVAEVTNTPWGERCCYVLSDNLNKTTSSIKKYQPIKKMHVSPFMPMEIDYEWTFTKPEQKINVSMSNSEEGNKFFNVGLRMKRNNISSYALARILLVYPLITLKIIFGIHWQALRLWLKKCPIYVHPSKI
jgi:DUF1365 family protein